MKSHTYEPLTAEEIKKEIRDAELINKVKEDEKRTRNHK